VVAAAGVGGVWLMSGPKTRGEVRWRGGAERRGGGGARGGGSLCAVCEGSGGARRWGELGAKGCRLGLLCWKANRGAEGRRVQRMETPVGG